MVEKLTFSTIKATLLQKTPPITRAYTHQQFRLELRYELCREDHHIKTSVRSKVDCHSCFGLSRIAILTLNPPISPEPFSDCTANIIRKSLSI